MDRDDADEALVRAAREGGGDDDLAAQLHALRDELTARASPRARLDHLAAMRRAASDPTVEMPVDETAEIPVEATVGTAIPLRRRHRNRAVVLVTAATVGVLGLTGGLAAAGRLPASAQDRVADIVKVVGINLPNHAGARDVGPVNGWENLRPTTPKAGASGTAPPVGPQGPGATGTLPGSSGSAPGHSSTGPGASEIAPGHTGSDPGNSGNAPGQPGEEPGNSANTPGQSGSNDNNRGNGDNRGESPGRTGSNGSAGNTPEQSRGDSGIAPGRNMDSIAPGTSGSARVENEDQAGSSPVQGADQ